MIDLEVQHRSCDSHYAQLIRRLRDPDDETVWQDLVDTLKGSLPSAIRGDASFLVPTKAEQHTLALGLLKKWAKTNDEPIVRVLICGRLVFHFCLGAPAICTENRTDDGVVNGSRVTLQSLVLKTERCRQLLEAGLRFVGPGDVLDAAALGVLCDGVRCA